MNAGETLTIWLQLFGLLAVETALVVGAAALISRSVASAAWRRTIWQVCFLSLLALTLSELTGTARGVVNWLAVKVSQEKRLMDGPTVANRNGLQPNAEQWTEEFRGKFVDQFAQEKQLKSTETAEASSRVAQPSGVDTQTGSEPTDPRSKQNPSRVKEESVDAVADLLPMLWLELIWLLGAGLVLARGCLAHALFALFRRHRQAVGDTELLSRVKALARFFGIKRRIHLIESSRLAGPIVFGVFRPVIGLPTDFTRRFSPVQQEAMLAHELAHVAAYDPVWYLLANWASAILWWHPLVWWARGRLHAASEMAADEASLVVAGGPIALAECLAEMGARLTRQHSLGWMGVGGSGLRSGLGQRVQRLVHLRGNSAPPPNRLRSALAKTFGPAALVATVILSTAWVGPQASTKGESMKTMKQTWVSSLAAFALLAATQEVTRAALAANAKGEGQPVDVARLLEDGKLLYETGKLDEAELRLKEAAKRAPQNEKASYYLSLIQERRYAQNTKDPNAIQTPSARAAENPTAPDLATKRQQDYYYRLMMERYHIMPPSTSLVVNPPRKPESDAIVPRLQTIVLDEVMFDGVPLPEVLRFLDEESRKRDPDKKGINFLINPNTTQSTPATVIDPQTGQPVAGPPPEAMEMNSVVIRFNLPLRNVRLKDVLNAIVRVADKPIEYSIEEYGVLFSQAANPSADSTVAHAGKSLGTDSLQVRTFKMDTDKLLPGMKRAFGMNLEGLPPDRSDKASAPPEGSVENLRAEVKSLETTLTNLIAQFTDQSLYVKKTRGRIAELEGAIKEKLSGEPGEARQTQVALRRLLTELGVDMDKPGKALFYNDLTGILMVRATTEDLAIVQGAVETLGGVSNAQWPQAGSGGEDASSSAADLMRQRYGPGSARP